jgi:hypothetical protein
MSRLVCVAHSSHSTVSACPWSPRSDASPAPCNLDARRVPAARRPERGQQIALGAPHRSCRAEVYRPARHGPGHDVDHALQAAGIERTADGSGCRGAHRRHRAAADVRHPVRDRGELASLDVRRERRLSRPQRPVGTSEDEHHRGLNRARQAVGRELSAAAQIDGGASVKDRVQADGPRGERGCDVGVEWSRAPAARPASGLERAPASSPSQRRRADRYFYVCARWCTPLAPLVQWPSEIDSLRPRAGQQRRATQPARRSVQDSRVGRRRRLGTCRLD